MAARGRFAIRIRRRSGLVTQIFPVVKRFAINKFNEHIVRTGSRHAPLAFLETLQFFLDHNEVTTLFDVEPLFRSFIRYYLRYCSGGGGGGDAVDGSGGVAASRVGGGGNEIFAYETLHFCIQNKQKLLTHSSVFSLYFPALLKLACWHPTALGMETVELLPALYHTGYVWIYVIRVDNTV